MYMLHTYFIKSLLIHYYIVHKNIYVFVGSKFSFNLDKFVKDHVQSKVRD